MTAEKKNEITFEQSLEQLEAIVRQLEDGRLGLSESLESYEVGIACLRRCYRVLEEAERKIEILSGIGADGRAETEPFDDDELSLDEKQQNRSQRRSRPRRDSTQLTNDDVDAPGRLF